MGRQYSLGKLFRNLVGKDARKIRQAFTRRVVGALDSPVGIPVAEAVTGMGEYDWTGSGAYTRKRVVKNSLIKGSTRKPARVKTARDETGALVVTHREYLGELYGPATSGFMNSVYEINPGLIKNFPWLAQIAANYDEYEFKQLVFEFRSMVTDSSSNGQCGTVIMATQYNPSHPPFDNKEAMMGYDGAVSARITDNLIHGVECDPAKGALSGALMVRSNPVTGSQDIKTYDMGKFNLAVTNLNTDYQDISIGEIWVYYKVRLAKPRLFAALGLFQQKDIFVNGQTIGASNWYSGVILRGVANNIGTVMQTQSVSSLSSSTGSGTGVANTVKYTFPPNVSGVYQIMMNMESLAQNLATVAYSYTTTGNVTVYNDLYAGGSTTTTSPSHEIYTGQATAVCWITRWTIRPATGGIANSITFTWNLSGNPSQAYAEVLELPDPVFQAQPQNATPLFQNPSGVQSTIS